MLIPITETQGIIKRDFELLDGAAGKDRLDPDDANAVQAGEFAVLDTTNPRRAGLGVTPTTANKPLMYQVFTERGRFDTQAVGKLTTLWSRPYEAETSVYDSTGGLAVGTALTVKLGTQTGVTTKLILRAAVSSGDIVYGHALNVVAASALPLGTTRLRFQLVGPTHILP